MTVVREEKADEDKIKQLEEEVQRLKAEVHLRVLSGADNFHFHFQKLVKRSMPAKTVRRLLVFASHTSTSALTATANTPCPAAYT